MAVGAGDALEQALGRILLGILCVATARQQRGDPHHPVVPHLAPAEVVEDGVLQDPLEQQRPFAGRPVSVVLDQADHGVLHDVERRVVIADRESGMQPGTALDAGEEAVKGGGLAHAGDAPAGLEWRHGSSLVMRRHVALTGLFRLVSVSGSLRCST